MKKINSVVLLWLRYDLRLDDHPALLHAVEHYDQVVPVFCWTPGEEAPWSMGAASKWWLHQSLMALEASLKKVGSHLILRKGSNAADVLSDLVTETGAEAIYWSRRYEPSLRAQEKAVQKKLVGRVKLSHYNSALLWEPWEIQTDQQKPYQVFTAYWKRALKTRSPLPPQQSPEKVPAPKNWPESESLESLSLLPKISWHEGFVDMWTPGELTVKAKVASFRQRADKYAAQRNYPWLKDGTSQLSPHLHFGELSPRRLWYEILKNKRDIHEVEVYLKEIGWREFGYHLIYHFPETVEAPLRDRFLKFPWIKDPVAFKQWQRGMTGYPIVDAGMRELWKTGWMHNRVRMIVASFLVKDLLISWKEGARWFWETLLDADLASNTLGWQWAGGCGADAAPYFRVFNPQLQGEKFDPEGAYIREHVPELAALNTRWIHHPAEAPPEELERAGIRLGAPGHYPLPMVNHAEARIRALSAFDKIK